MFLEMQLAKNETDFYLNTQYNKLISKMTKIYGTAKVCPFAKQDCNVAEEGLALNPGMQNIMEI